MKDLWMQTYSGLKFHPYDPKPDQIRVVDIAEALAKTCRYGGHCYHYYSVAEHSIWVSRLVSRENALWGLLHDAAEAYIGDIPKPVKVGLDIEECERAILKCVAEKFDMELSHYPREVKDADIAMLHVEPEQLMRHPPEGWDLPDTPFKVHAQKLDLDLLGFDEAAHAFIERFEELYE